MLVSSIRSLLNALQEIVRWLPIAQNDLIVFRAKEITLSNIDTFFAFAWIAKFVAQPLLGFYLIEF
jgi:hypothetical protein